MESIGCYCLTEPEAGPGVRSISTTAERHGDDWVINGEKHWITNGGVADVAIVFARGEAGMTAFLVPASTPGLERKPMPGRGLGHRGSDHALIRFHDVRLPANCVLGSEGHGFEVAVGAFATAGLASPLARSAYIRPASMPQWTLPASAGSSASGSATSR